jgi:hypothetical protein
MTLGGAPPGLEKCSVGKKDMDVASLSVSDINGAAGVYRDPRRLAHACVLEGLQGCAARFKFVDEAGSGVSKENVAQRIDGECHRLVELPRAVALISPGAEEFKRRGRLRFGRGIRAISTRNEEKYSGKRGLRKSPSHRIGIWFRHAANLRPEIE